MKRIVILAALASLAAGAQADAASLNGLWMRGDGNAKVRIGPCGAQVCAVNEWIKPGTKGEKTGDRLIMSISPSGDNGYEGTANDPQRGLSYNIKIDVRDESMTTRGCVLAALICKSVSWSRLQ